MSGYDVERVEALLRERAHGLTRTPVAPKRGSTREEPIRDPAPAPTVVLVPEVPLEEPPPAEPYRGGACNACDRPIAQGRLRAVPDAVRCIDCQFAFEAGRLDPQPARV